MYTCILRNALNLCSGGGLLSLLPPPPGKSLQEYIYIYVRYDVWEIAPVCRWSGLSRGVNGPARLSRGAINRTRDWKM